MLDHPEEVLGSLRQGTYSAAAALAAAALAAAALASTAATFTSAFLWHFVSDAMLDRVKGD